MKSFICEVLEKLIQESQPISETTFILPSKRAGSFLLKELSELSNTNIFAPTIFSIEEFTEKVSGLLPIDNTISLFEFYEVYQNLTPKDKTEDFETFTSWAQSLIHDFNEVDRYLIDHRSFFNYLSEIQDINHWYLQPEKTELIQNYLSFWKHIPEYYEELHSKLLKKKLGYQGLIYRAATEQISGYLEKNSNPHVFIGFNALNAAEQLIIQKMLKSGHTKVFWDTEKTFYEDENHGASLFLRDYLTNWDHYKKTPYTDFSDHYSDEKNIEFIGVPKNIGQAKYIGEILINLTEDERSKTAIVLGEEELLLPVLNSLPPTLEEINITMGFPIKNSPVQILVDHLFRLHVQNSKHFYFKDVIAVIQHPSLNTILGDAAQNFIRKINGENLVYLESEEIITEFPDHLKPVISACFNYKLNSVSRFINDIHSIIQHLKTAFKDSNNRLGLEFLYHFHVLFNKLENLNAQYPYLKSLKSLYGFYKEMMSTETIDFQGKPFKGLQLMGMLESRAMDFENVIITSLNEGTLPAGKSDNSFIPYDLKKAYNLPTYKEKDAVYTYHFYRLLQRAKKVFLIYNTEADGLNSGEKSRFITQLEIDKKPAHHYHHKLMSPKVPKIEHRLKSVSKTPEVMEKIRALCNYGLSPSALTSYIRNPIDFYTQYILGIRDREEMEETVAFNTLGTVVHNALENLYKAYEGMLLSEEVLKNFIKAGDSEIENEFEKCYSKAPLDKGKNMLIFEVAKRYLQNFLKTEMKRIKNGEEVRIMQIESNRKIEFPVEELPHSVYLRGKVDRFEVANGIPRIIDYKTGKVESRNLVIENWEDITQDYDNFSKSFQVLTYASLIAEEKDLTFPAEAGIISFKNLSSGFLKFEKKVPGSRAKDSLISQETLRAFQGELKKLIIEICNPEIPFLEKEIKEYGNF